MIIKHMKTLLLLIIFTSSMSMLQAADKALNETPSPENAALKKTAPKENNTTTGFIQELTETRIHNGPNRSGKEVYEFRCKGCHAKNTQGAPMPDDQFAWKMRLQERGLKILLKHSMEGTSNYLMPPKGGCRDCNQKEVYAAVFYMLNRSGNKIEQKDLLTKTPLKVLDKSNKSN